MSELQRIEEMTDTMLEYAARRAYLELDSPSENLKLLYDTWFGQNDKPKKNIRRVHSETIYKLCVFEKEFQNENSY